MNCNHFETNLDSLVLGRLTPKEAAEARAHCASCPECARKLAQTEEIRTVAASSNFHASPDFTARVMEATRKSRSIRISRADYSLKEVVAEFFPRKHLAVSIAIHAAVLLIAAFIFFRPDKLQTVNDVVVIENAPITAQTQRIAAAKHTTGVGADCSIDVSVFLTDCTLYVVASNDEGSRFLTAYTREQISKLPKEIMESAYPARVAAGRLYLQESLLAEDLCGSKNVVLLAMSDRFEIWDARNFEKYRSHKAV